MNRPPPSQGVLISACVMLAAFFMPWFGLEGSGLTGLSLAKLGSDAAFAWVVPIMAGITVFVSLQRRNNRGWGFLTGLAPILGISYGFIKITGEAGDQGMRVALDILMHAFAVGGYLTLASAIVIIVAACQEAHLKPSKADSSDDRQHKLSESGRLADNSIPNSSTDFQFPGINQNMPTFLASIGMCGGFFMPWVTIGGVVGITGHTLAKMSYEGQGVWAILVIAAVAAITHMDKPVRGINIWAGILPFGLLAYCRNKMGKELFENLGFGAWLILACGLVLIFAPVKSAAKD